MENIGVKINMTKTLVSEEGSVRVEFAKRIFFNHQELSPLGYDLMNQVAGNCYQLPLLLQELYRRG
jgi:hypothetical protein